MFCCVSKQERDLPCNGPSSSGPTVRKEADKKYSFASDTNQNWQKKLSKSHRYNLLEKLASTGWWEKVKVPPFHSFSTYYRLDCFFGQFWVKPQWTHPVKVRAQWSTTELTEWESLTTHLHLAWLRSMECPAKLTSELLLITSCNIC